MISDADYDIALADYDTARSALAVGEASVVQAEAALRQAEINLGYTTIRSPVKGVIVDRRVNIGQTVVASLNAPSLFLIAKDLTRMQVWASVNEADIGRIRAGQTVRFTVDAFPGETFVGEVAQVRLNATMTQNVVTYTVVVTADNPEGRLLPYLTANLQVRDRPARPASCSCRTRRCAGSRGPSRSCPRECGRDALAPARTAGAPDRGVGVGRRSSASCGRSPVQVGPERRPHDRDQRAATCARGSRSSSARAPARRGEGEASPFAPRIFGGGRR